MTANLVNKLATLQASQCIRRVHKLRSLARGQNLIIIMYSNEGGTLNVFTAKLLLNYKFIFLSPRKIYEM